MSERDVDLAEHIAELSKSAEAGVALVTIAIIDEWLEKLLLTALRDDLSNAVAERMFDSYGPFYELAPKADMAFALKLIDDETLASLRVLRDIRNKFAHTRDVLTFASPVISSLCKKLPKWSPAITDLQKLFNGTAMSCVQKIDAKTQSLIFEHATSPGK